MVKTCLYCARLYPAWRSNQKFCSDRCRVFAHYGALKVPVSKTCPVCGDAFKTIRGNQKYCSPTCHDIANNKKQHFQKICPECGRFYWTTTNKRIFCSDGCAKHAKANRDRGRDR